MYWMFININVFLIFTGITLLTEDFLKKSISKRGKFNSFK